jgi:U2-associated protein SR140
MAQGSYDDGDPDTTNLYVGNLAPTITEELLQEMFAKFGEIYSVKIMWPRSEVRPQDSRSHRGLASDTVVF